MSQDAQVNQLCSIIPMLNTTILRQNAVIDKLVESLDQKNKELEQTGTLLTEIKTLKEEIKNVKQSLRENIREDTRTDISYITPPAPVNDPVDSKPTMSKEEIFAANMKLNISPDILSDMVGQIRCLHVAYEPGKLVCGVGLIGSGYMRKFARTFNLVLNTNNYDWYNILSNDVFTHGYSSFVVPYRWIETYFPNVNFKTIIELSALKYIRDNIMQTEITGDTIAMRMGFNVTNQRLYKAYAESLSTTYDIDIGIIKLSVKQYADFLEKTK